MRAREDAPRPGSIITLTVSVRSTDGDDLPAGLDVVALEAHEDGSVLVSADEDSGREVSAWIGRGEWTQRAEHQPSRAGDPAPREED
jgi:hypothetical protein